MLLKTKCNPSRYIHTDEKLIWSGNIKRALKLLSLSSLAEIFQTYFQ